MKTGWISLILRLTAKLCLLLILISQILVFSSCFTSKNLAKGPVTEEIIPKLKTGKIYYINTKSELRVQLRITGIDSLKIYGNARFMSQRNRKINEYAYEESINTFLKNTDKISVSKFDPILTTLAVSVVVLFLIWVISGSGSGGSFVL